MRSLENTRDKMPLTNFPLSLTDMGFSTTTVWVLDGGVDCWKKVKPMNRVSISYLLILFF